MFTRKLIWSAKARIELLEILEFYKIRNGNSNYSRKLYTEINEILKLCRTYSLIGKRTDIQNVRVVLVQHYLIFYRILEKEIAILTIWYARRNPDDLII